MIFIPEPAKRVKFFLVHPLNILLGTIVDKFSLASYNALPKSSDFRLFLYLFTNLLQAKEKPRIHWDNLVFGTQIKMVLLTSKR